MAKFKQSVVECCSHPCYKRIYMQTTFGVDFWQHYLLLDKKHSIPPPLPIYVPHPPFHIEAHFPIEIIYTDEKWSIKKTSKKLELELIQKELENIELTNEDFEEPSIPSENQKTLKFLRKTIHELCKVYFP